jgi:glycosyltransferase involved in cell wall biosynthesis
VKIALFNWRDLHHPKAGGAEVATHRLALGLVARGHDVTWVTSAYPGAAGNELRGGYRVIRAGSELTCRFYGLAWLFKNRDRVDVVIDEVNTLPFLSRLAYPKQVVVWMHQLAREVWHAEAPKVVGAIGYALEPALMAIYARTPIVTISQSSAATFAQFGLRGPIHVAEIALEPPSTSIAAPKPGLIGYVGRLAPSKRVDHIIRALAHVRRRCTSAELAIVGAGNEREISRLNVLAQELGIGNAVHFYGRVSSERRDEIMRTLDVAAMASLREGWGLVVSEAARYGVPSVVYPVPGLVDAVIDEKTGLVTAEQTPEALAEDLVRVIEDRALRAQLGAEAMQYLLQFDDERFVGRFERVLSEVAR